jgi:transposase-like protein
MVQSRRSVATLDTKTRQANERGQADVLAFMSFPTSHRTKLHSTNPIERLNGEIKRRTEVIGTFPNEAAINSLACFRTPALISPYRLFVV